MVINAIGRRVLRVGAPAMSGIVLASMVTLVSACQDGTTSPQVPGAMSPLFAKGGGGGGGAKPATKIAFVSQRDEPGNVDLYVANSDGTGITRLTTHLAVDDQPALSHDGTRVAFVSSRYGGKSVFVMQIGGPGFWQLTAGNECADPAWSPDDSRIAYSCYINGDSEIYSSAWTGGATTQLTNNVVPDKAPSYSPRTPHIVFSSLRDGNYEVYTMRTDGTSATRLTNFAGPDLSPTWSPDGKLIAFVSSRSGAGLEIHTMKPDGSQVLRVTNNLYTDEEPAWSPDSRSLAFQSYLGGLVSVYTTNIDGSALANITAFSATQPTWAQ